MMVTGLPAMAVLSATPAAAAAGDPDHVNTTIEGCNNNGTITLPNGSGQFICPDADYTTGNLGKGWNELDLVPYRVTFATGSSAPSTQTYTLAIAADYNSGGHIGYDVISVPVLNTALSSTTGCTLVTTGPQSVTTDTSTIYRKLTITQARSTTCVYDYYMRLALGAHSYPGSSLHGYLLNQNLTSSGIGQQDIPIPVKEILPQSLSKDMSATQGSSFAWNVTKVPSQASVSFDDTCAAGTVRSTSVGITVTWTKLPASPNGDITVITNIYATNPASRTITTNVEDQLYSGTTALTGFSHSYTVNVGPNSTDLHTFTDTVPSGTTDLNDIATATYTDLVTGVPVPGNTTATASATVQSSGTGANDTVDITDTESITGPFEFSVATPSAGSFDSYTAGTHTTGPVSWRLANQSTSGSVTFTKTIYVEDATVGTGSLSDTANVVAPGTDPTDPTTPPLSTASLGVGVSAGATTSLGVTKTTTLQLANAQTFNLELFDGSTDPGTDTGQSTAVTIPALSNGPVDSPLITGLSPDGTYYLHEDAQAPYPAQDSASKTFSLVPGDITSCTDRIPLNNAAAPATAQVKKDTLPSTSSGDWTFTLSDTPAGGTPTVIDTVTNVVANSGNYVQFSPDLANDGDTYTITETPQTGFDLTGITGDIGGNSARVASDTTALTCSFTLDLTQDSGQVFECDFTNTQRGNIIVKKVTDPSTDTTTQFPFTGSWGGGTSFNLVGGGSQDSGALPPGSYNVSEGTEPAGWKLTGSSCDHGQTPSSIDLTAGETVTCTFTNTEQGTLKVVKTVNGAAPTGSQSFTFQLRQGATASAAGTTLETEVANAGNGGVINFTTLLVPGSTYQLCEVIPAPGWGNNLASQFTVFNPGADNTTVCTDFTVTAGQTLTISVDNSPPPTPQGNAFTIGYWKNHASCSGTGASKTPVLDQTLAKADPTGIQLGSLTLHAGDCKKAVALLNKSDINSGKKMASNPLYGLAAQYLAAELNIISGAGSCPAANSAIATAQGLFTKYSFTGTGNYTLSKTDAAAANAAASTLDQYNNNQLC